MSYDKTRSVAKRNPEEHYKHTLLRIQKIQSHLDTAPRSSKLKDKVCIITGVGSLKGIGWDVLRSRKVLLFSLQSRATAILFAHEGEKGNPGSLTHWPLTGAKHLYLMDLDGTNLPNLKETIENRYPDVQVYCRVISFVAWVEYF